MSFEILIINFIYQFIQNEANKNVLFVQSKAQIHYWMYSLISKQLFVSIEKF